MKLHRVFCYKDLTLLSYTFCVTRIVLIMKFQIKTVCVYVYILNFPNFIQTLKLSVVEKLKHGEILNIL